MALSISLKTPSPNGETRLADTALVPSNSDRNVNIGTDGVEITEHDVEASNTIARGPRRLRTSSESEDEPARKRTKQSTSPLPSLPENPPAKPLPHPLLRDTVTMNMEASPDRPSSLNVAETDCAICLDTFTASPTQSVARHAQCTPLYHTTCLERWVEEGSPTCPNCRRELFPTREIIIFDDESDDVDSEVLRRLVFAATREDDWGLSDEEARDARGFLVQTLTFEL